MIKVSYESITEGINKPEVTKINIFEGKYFVQYNVPRKAEEIVKKMRQDRRKGVLYSRGMMIQNFPRKSEEEILEIVQQDIKNGVYEAKEKTKKEIKIKNLVIKRI